MSLICPACGSAEFSIRDSVELGPDSHWDERTMHRASCSACGSRFICSYLEKRSFRPDRDDSVSHVAYTTGRMLWHLAGIPARKPRRRRASLWRVWWALRVLTMSRQRGDAMVIEYRRI